MLVAGGLAGQTDVEVGRAGVRGKVTEEQRQQGQVLQVLPLGLGKARVYGPEDLNLRHLAHEMVIAGRYTSLEYFIQTEMEV